MSTIDRDIVIKKYINPDIEKFHNSDVKIVLENLKQNILKMPSADRPQGEWIYPTDVFGFGRCSNCKALWDKSLIDNIFFKYCPRCGARMRGEDDE